jgi:hypothetical protein
MAFGLASHVAPVHCRVWQMDGTVTYVNGLGTRPLRVLLLVPQRAAWLACEIQVGRMEWKLRAQALESDSLGLNHRIATD